MIKRIKKEPFLFLAIVFSFIGLFFRALSLWENSMAFTYDQGRDLLDLRAMVIERKISLIGPTTSLHGVFSGPFWYWFSLPIYLATGGHPMSTEIFLLILSFLTPIFVYFLSENKRLGLILALIYTFAYSFFGHSIVALNTNPVVFITPLILLSLSSFFVQKKERYLFLAMFLVGSLFHFEALIGLFFLPVVFACVIVQGNIKDILKNVRGILAFFLPLLPLVFFDFRHNFIQTRAFLSLILGEGSSLTPGNVGLTNRLFDRLRIFVEVFQNSSQNTIFAIIFFLLTVYLLVDTFFLKKPKKDQRDYLNRLVFVFLVAVFTGFILYPYALWPWYLGTVDCLMLTIFGFGLYLFSKISGKFSFLAWGFLTAFLIINITKYFPWPIRQGFSEDTANLRTRLKVVDLVYNDSGGTGMKIFTFAPYVYDYPYQYLIWWRAKTRYQYLPEEYVYLTNQPKYVTAKEEADRLIPQKKSECEYLIIEPYESQKQWFLDWRGRFPGSEKVWEIGKTKVERLCQ